MQSLSVPKEFNLKRHYSSLHGEKFNKYDGKSRVTLMNDFKKKVKQQTGMFTKVGKVQTCSLAASYTVVLEMAKSKKPLMMEV
jgi:3-hydroxy-3-methylglutaryl CoA synthase